MRRAFVVQMRPGETFAGRVVHVRSGEAAQFQTVEDFLTFIERMLEQEEAEQLRR